MCPHFGEQGARNMATMAARSYIGTSKGVNQDSCCAFAAETSFGDAAFAAVCDGVGGLSAGEYASCYAVGELSRWFEDSFPVYAVSNVIDGAVDLANLKGAWTVLLELVNERLRDRGLSEGLRMGTTACALLVLADRFAIAHVGDCRAYRLRGGVFTQLTRDQTLIQHEVDAGRISAEEALTHPKSSVIIQALGAQEGLEPEFYFGDVRDGDTFLVACDGFYRRLDVDALADKLAHVSELSEGAMDGVLADAIDRVVDKGENDNITAVLLHMGKPGSMTSPLLLGDCMTENLAEAQPCAGNTALDGDEPTCDIEGGE